MATETVNRIGYGLLKPLHRQHNDFAAGTGRQLLQSCVETIVNTPAAGFSGRIAGTYPWRMNFGSWLVFLRHNNTHSSVRRFREDLATVYASEAIARWEPRVEVRLSRSGVLSGNGSNESRVRIYFGVTAQLGGGVHTGSLAESYHEVAI